MDQLALRWIVRDSALGEGDGVILGASKSAQIQGVAQNFENGKLNDVIVKQLELIKDKVEGIESDAETITKVMQ
ncbi:hypothetical protein LTR28_010258 [Elasticomyces elasticus]|nr:hypothetical protein LTR28_010258 [Elasticomyces elasticus]